MAQTIETIPDASQILQICEKREESNEVVERMKPFYEAYYQMLHEKTDAAKAEMKEKKFKFKRIDINPHAKITLESKHIRIHNLHYGKMTSDDWKRRAHSSNLPFRRLQNDLRKEGYYLIDESTFEFSMKLVLYHHKPVDYARTVMWHGMNILEGDKPSDEWIQPFQDEYYNLLIAKATAAIAKMQEEQILHVRLDIDFHEKIENDTNSIKLHSLHYGKVSRSWSLRIPTKNLPFRRAQKVLAEKGYYLLDESDPSASFRTRIILFACKPKHYNTKDLWHKMNVLEEDI